MTRALTQRHTRNCGGGKKNGERSNAATAAGTVDDRYSFSWQRGAKGTDFMAFQRHHEGEISRKHGLASDTRLR
jgi:hypothetical protein